MDRNGTLRSLRAPASRGTSGMVSTARSLTGAATGEYGTLFTTNVYAQMAPTGVDTPACQWRSASGVNTLTRPSRNALAWLGSSGTEGAASNATTAGLGM